MISRARSIAEQAGTARLIRSAAAAAIIPVLVLAGCGNKDKPKDPLVSQTAAKVNKEEITVHQINFVLQQQRGIAPEHAASAGRAALERLVDQELALQKAQELKLDREPRVLQQLEAARRDVIARAYFDKIIAGAPKPRPTEIKAYYDAHPALFRERRVYNLQELVIQASPEQVTAAKAKLAGTKAVADFVNYLKAGDIKFTGNQAVRTAEQLPLADLDRIAAMKDGQAIFSAMPNGARVVILASSRSQPVDEARATPAIEQFLLNERKRKVGEDDMKALRAAAKIEYIGEYATDGVPEAKAAAPAASEVAAGVATPLAVGPIASAAPQVEVDAVALLPASAPAASVLEKGLKGFK